MDRARCFYAQQATPKKQRMRQFDRRIGSRASFSLRFFLWGWATASRRESLFVSLGERHIYNAWELTAKRRLTEMHNASTTSNHFLFRSPKSWETSGAEIPSSKHNRSFCTAAFFDLPSWWQTQTTCIAAMACVWEKRGFDPPHLAPING